MLGRVLENVASESDLQHLASIIENDKDGAVIAEMESIIRSGNQNFELPGIEKCNEMVNRVLQADKAVPEATSSIKSITPVISLFRKIAVAVIFIVATIGILWFARNVSLDNLENKDFAGTKVLNDRLPASNKATLTLSDGSVITLDSISNGSIAIQGMSKVVKSQTGQLLYQTVTNANSTNELAYNTISIPRGGQYELVLSDGTKIWMNAASTLRFPADFLGTERDVELTGEAYFEVAKNTSKPFNVITKNVTVNVLGTHFNVMAYNDEAIVKTVLVEGSVRVKSGSNSALLKPGNQAAINLNDNSIKVGIVDLDEAISWKNGYFQFTKLDDAFLRQLSRWYDIDLVYENRLKENEFKGRIARNIKLSNVIEALKISGFRFRIENNKLIVM